MRAIDHIQELGETLATAVSSADWDAAIETLVARRAALEQAFAELPDGDDVLRQRLVELAESIMHADRELVAVAQQARSDTISQLRALQRGRSAAEIYQSNAG